MYPRVKVRVQEDPVKVNEQEDPVKVKEQEDPAGIREEATSFVLRVIESLSIEDHYPSKNLVSSQGSDSRNGLHSSHARISKSHPKDSLTPFVSASKGKNNKGIYEDNRTNIRASSVPRPRAVLSSPDNDGIIGNQNQRIRERGALRKQTLKSDSKNGHQSQVVRERTLPKRQTLSPTAHGRGKLSLRSGNVDSTLGAVKVSKEADNMQASELSAARQRIPIKRG